jgi:hypothetical protein
VRLRLLPWLIATAWAGVATGGAMTGAPLSTVTGVLGVATAAALGLSAKYSYRLGYEVCRQQTLRSLIEARTARLPAEVWVSEMLMHRIPWPPPKTTMPTGVESVRYPPEGEGEERQDG